MRPVLIATLMLAVACGTKSNDDNSSTDGGSTSTPTLKIDSPTAGATIHFDTTNTDVDVAFTVTNFTLKDPGKCGSLANCGHVELFIDGATCNDMEDTPMQPFNGVASASPGAVGLDYCPGFPNIAGSHVISAELHHDDLSPVKDASGHVIKDQVTVTAVQDDATGGTDGGSTQGDCGTETNPIEVGPGHSFTPATCTVTAGSTVHWHFNMFHTVTSDPGAPATFDSGTMSSGDFTFMVPADATSGESIPYRCTIHSTFANGTCSGMCATLTVQ